MTPSVSTLNLTRDKLKRLVKDLLESQNTRLENSYLDSLPCKSVITTIMGYLVSDNQAVKNRAVELMGTITHRLAQQDIEAARVVVRRLIWNLTEESGTCPYGAPEAIGEILACDEQLAREFAPILVSYINPDGNLLDHKPLLIGAIRGIGRLGQVNPKLVSDAVIYLKELTKSENGEIKLAAIQVLYHINMI